MSANDDFDPIHSPIMDIIVRDPKSAEIWYGHSMLTAILFPATAAEAQKNDGYISQQLGDYEYILEASLDPESKNRMLPFGKYPRLIMAWMAKRIRVAGKKKDEYVNPELCSINIPSIGRLAEELGLGKGGKTLHDLNEHLKRMTQSIISIHRVSGFVANKRHEVVKMPFALASTYDEAENIANGSFSIMLNPEVYRQLASETAPFDTRASRFLLAGRSVLPYDLYVWLVGTLYGLKKPMTFSWDWLYERFGYGIQNQRNFRSKFRRALEKVQAVYPEAHVSVSLKGILLKPSRSPIAPRKKEDDS